MRLSMDNPISSRGKEKRFGQKKKLPKKRGGKGANFSRTKFNLFRADLEGKRKSASDEREERFLKGGKLILKPRKRSLASPKLEIAKEPNSGEGLNVSKKLANTGERY